MSIVFIHFVFLSGLSSVPNVSPQWLSRALLRGHKCITRHMPKHLSTISVYTSRTCLFIGRIQLPSMETVQCSINCFILLQAINPAGSYHNQSVLFLFFHIRQCISYHWHKSARLGKLWALVCSNESLLILTRQIKSLSLKIPVKVSL